MKKNAGFSVGVYLQTANMNRKKTLGGRVWLGVGVGVEGDLNFEGIEVSPTDHQEMTIKKILCINC